MTLRLGALLLAAALFLSGSALTPEECKLLLTPVSLGDVSEMYGRWNFHMGFNNNELYRTILGITDSSWMNVTLSNNETLVTHREKLNGTCLATQVKATISGDTVSVSIPNIRSEFHVLPGCDGCLVMNINATASHLDKLAQNLKLDVNITAEEVAFPALYLMAREPTLNETDLERFRQQASCLGFSGEPQFHYDPENSFCADGEGVLTKI